jgi:VIT1/CCC1 family predicted Fe2+/Mn2+ transporter
MPRHFEQHQMEHIGWLRAAVLGANDGIISTTSLLVGLSAADTSFRGLILAGIAAFCSGAFSMAAGEYISVSSQKDTEIAALTKERLELETHFPEELEELTHIYQNYGLSPKLAHNVAKELMQHQALNTHAREELGITPHLAANPLQASLFSAMSFSIGSLFPLLLIFLCNDSYRIPSLIGINTILLGSLGAIAAKIGGASLKTGALRVMSWGTLAFSMSMVIGHLLNLSLTSI